MLQVENLTYKVMENGKEVTLLRDVSFDVQDGEMLVITGPNGGGKSTLAKVLMGIVPASSGKIILDGVDLTQMTPDERAKAGIGYAFQQPPVFKGMTVERLLNLAAGRELPEEVCCTLLSNVGLCAREYLKREVDATLSGGEIKRIEIATVLARHTKLSLFDEPEAGIDLWSFANLIDVFQSLRGKLHGTLIIISHQERILQIADEIVVISGGTLKEMGPGAEIFPRLMEGNVQCDACAKREAVFS